MVFIDKLQKLNWTNKTLAANCSCFSNKNTFNSILFITYSFILTCYYFQLDLFPLAIAIVNTN